jgi:glycerophosphoryl diester phosphodiesterase
MKTLFTIILVFVLSSTGHSQEKNIETESVKLDNLISFIIENYSIKTDSTQTKNITFLIETYADSFNAEDGVILKQAFKLLSKRVTEDDHISIVMYSSFNGIALKLAQATDLKKLLYTVEHPKSSVKSFEEDGIELAYSFANENFLEDAENSVVMIRIPNRTSEVSEVKTQNINKKVQKKSNAVVLTAIALLPEIISVIKNK